MPNGGGSGDTGNGGGGLRYEPLEPRSHVSWGPWLRWLLRGFGRLGRGVELAAAGVLVSGAVVTWHFASPAETRSAGGDVAEHACCCQRAAVTAGSAGEGSGAGSSHCPLDAAAARATDAAPKTTTQRPLEPSRHGEQGETRPLSRPREGRSVVTL